MLVTCLFCGKVGSRKHIDQHMGRHTEERPYQCEICDETFIYQSNLYAHLKTHLSLVITCPYCALEVKNLTVITRHKKSKDSPKQFKCPHCCMSYIKGKHLDNHMMENHQQPLTPTISQKPLKRMASISNKSASQQPYKIPAVIDENVEFEGNDDEDFIPETQQMEEDIASKTAGSIKRACDAGESEVVKRTRITEDSHMAELDDVFILKAWSFTREDIFAKSIISRAKKEFMIPVLKFLHGLPVFGSPDDLLQFLAENPEGEVGKFVTALMIIDHVRSLSLNELPSFFDSKLPLLSETYQLLLKKIVILIFRRHVRLTCTYDDLMDVIPDSLLVEINFDSCLHLASESDYGVGAAKDLTTQNENECMRVILQEVLNLMTSDLCLKSDGNGASSLDANVASTERMEKWSKTAIQYIFDLFNTKQDSLLSIQLLYDVKFNIGTLPFFFVRHGSSKSPLHLHKEVVSVFSGDASIDQDIVVDATPQDVNVLIHLLYKNHDIEWLKGKITCGVFRLALNLKIADIWGFLFREDGHYTLMDPSNKLDIFRIVIILRRNAEVDSFAASFNTLFLEMERSRCFVGLSSEDVIYFFSRPTVKLDPLDAYKILIKWSFNKAGKECWDELTAEYSSDVNECFSLVRNVLPIAGLRSHSAIICRQKFISLRDMHKTFHKK